MSAKRRYIIDKITFSLRRQSNVLALLQNKVVTKTSEQRYKMVDKSFCNVEGNVVPLLIKRR